MATSSSLGRLPFRLKLHVYDHCPYCVRVELFLSWRKVEYERIVYGYGDQSHETGPKKLMGKKLLPVLEMLEDGKESAFMGESLDIIAFLDDKLGSAPMREATGAATAWVKTLKPSQRILCRPRILQMPVYDWENQKMLHMQNQSMEGRVSTDAAMKQSDEMKKIASARLEELGASPLLARQDGEYTYDDITCFELRTLSCVKSISWQVMCGTTSRGRLQHAWQSRTLRMLLIEEAIDK